MAYHSKYSGVEVDALLDKIKDDNVGSIDSSLSTTSDNPVKNKVITEELNKKANKTDIATINGQPLTNGGNIEVATDAYDDTEIKGKLTELAEKVNEKQDALNAGQGISINHDTKTISCTLDTTIFKVVDSLPTSPTSSDENKIHLVLSSSSEEGNTYDEYLWTNDSWERIGSFRPSVDLSRYAEKSYVDSQIEDEATARTNSDVELQTQINGKQDNIDSFSADEKAAFLVSLGLGKIGVISQKQNWTSDYSSYTVSDVVRGIIPQYIIDHWISLSTQDTFGDGNVEFRFNEETGYFECNDLVDITLNDAINIIQYGQAESFLRMVYEQKKVRVVFCANIGARWDMDGHIGVGPFTERVYCKGILRFGRVYKIPRLTYDLSRCYRCKEILYLNMKNCTNPWFFDKFYALITFLVINMRASFNLSNSPLLSNESILFLISHEISTSTITLTLHPDAYSRAMADADILAALEQHTNISLASA